MKFIINSSEKKCFHVYLHRNSLYDVYVKFQFSLIAFVSLTDIINKFVLLPSFYIWSASFFEYFLVCQSLLFWFNIILIFFKCVLVTFASTPSFLYLASKFDSSSSNNFQTTLISYDNSNFLFCENSRTDVSCRRYWYIYLFSSWWTRSKFMSVIWSYRLIGLVYGDRFEVSISTCVVYIPRGRLWRNKRAERMNREVETSKKK